MLVNYEVCDTFATITMDDGNANVMSLQMQAKIHAALDRAAAERPVVVLTGRPGMFSGGFDLQGPFVTSGTKPTLGLVSTGAEGSVAVLGELGEFVVDVDVVDAVERDVGVAERPPVLQDLSAGRIARVTRTAAASDDADDGRR